MIDGLTRSLFPSRGSWIVLVSCSILAGALMLSGAPPALASGVGSPRIESTAVTNIIEQGVTLEAQIDPQGSEAAYEFRLVWQDADPPAPGEPVTGGEQIQGGHIAAGSEDQTVSAVVTNLQPGYTYWYEVVASNSAGKAKAGPYSFGFLNDGAYPNGTGPGPPYRTEESQLAIESGDIAAEKTLEEARELPLNEPLEPQPTREPPPAEAPEEATTDSVDHVAPVCVVPSLKGDTLSAAQTAIDKAHCRLGKVARPKGHHDGQFVVTQQRVSVGGKLPSDTTIGVTLGGLLRRR